MNFLLPGAKIFFVIMSSVFDTDKPLHLKYDLKGSTVGRVTSEEDCENGAVQKDQNLMKSGRAIGRGLKCCCYYYYYYHYYFYYYLVLCRIQ